MAREVAAPMSAIKNMTVVSNDGASQLSRNVSNGVHQTTQLIKDSTGLDLISLLQGMGGGTSNGATNGVSNDDSSAVSDAGTPELELDKN